MHKLSIFFLAGILLVHTNAFSQTNKWQQRIRYNMDVSLDVATNKIKGTQKIEYWNNSTDTLKRLFMHLYWNAFQPNSSMDVRSRELGKKSVRTDKNGNQIPEWDARVRDRISKLDSTQIGYNRVAYVLVNGKKQQLKEHETILEIILDKPILPKTKLPATLEVAFEAQVPLQIRRAGRDNNEGVRYSISQWYPKMVEYDNYGWNANPYIAREFHGVWGDYNVKITIDKNYMVAATGVLQNANQIGMGYTQPGYKAPKPAGNTLTWNFAGNNIHDFVWAADPDYVHEWKQLPNGPALHVFYKSKDAKADSAWKNVLWAAEKVLPYIEQRFGKYPWPTYSFIQGGDGGMEYAMATLLRGPGIGTVVHEWMHSWYQQLLATNESLYAWMDEGFTSFAENEVMSYYNQNWAAKSPFINNEEKNKINKLNEEAKNEFPLKQADNYVGYFNLARSPYEEPLTTHADHFNTNFGYSLAAYSKGSVFLGQLGYIVSDSLRDKILLEYYNQWKFKHPDVNDFIRIAENVSGIHLQWYKEYWVNTTKTIDYGVGTIDEVDNKAVITLKRIGLMPMPVDVLVVYRDGTKEMHYVPLNLMYGQKPAEGIIGRTVHDEWRWTHPEYQLSITKRVADIKEIHIDPSYRMADMNRNNNRLIVP